MIHRKKYKRLHLRSISFFVCWTFLILTPRLLLSLQSLLVVLKAEAQKLMEEDTFANGLKWDSGNKGYIHNCVKLVRNLEPTL